MPETVGLRTTLGVVGAWLWGFNAFLGSRLVVFGLSISDPIEPEDWFLSGVFLLLFVVIPIALAIVSYRAVSFALSAPLIAGGLAIPPLLYWIVIYG